MRLTSRIDRPTFLVLVLLLVTGLALVATSVAVETSTVRDFTASWLRELGIVLFAVFSISLVYELWLADKYEETFLGLLRDQVQQGESNAAMCARLGIQHIFATRDKFEQQYPFAEMAAKATSATLFHITGRSLFLLLTHSQDLKKAIAAGAHFQLCLLDLCLPADALRKSPDVEPKDVEAAVAVFVTHVVDWLRREKPVGSIEVRCHQYHLLDSCFVLRGVAEEMCIWELSFGRDLGSKRIFQLDPQKPLGVDLTTRYDTIWQSSRIVLEYSGGEISTDELSASVHA